MSIIYLSLLFVLSSCNNPNLVETKINNNDEANSLNKDSEISLNNLSTKVEPKGKIIGYEIVEVNGKKKKIPIYYDPNDTSDAGIKALACDYYSVNHFVFDRYEPKSGKSIGIMNQKPQYKNASELHKIWGFNGYKVNNSAEKNNMKNIGYDYSNIMVGVQINYGQYLVPTGTFSKYYVDEPFERQSISSQYMKNLANDIYSINSSAELFMGSWFDNSFAYDYYHGILYATSNTRIMCDQYYDGTIFYGDDQRPYWTWFKSNYGTSRNTANWMSLIIDGIQDDFDMLFDKANSYGLNTLWLYAGDANNNPGIDVNLTQSNYNTYLPQFCNSAFQKGWLRKFAKYYKYMYSCPEYFEDPCYCQENDTGWQLAWIQYLGTYEIYP